MNMKIRFSVEFYLNCVIYNRIFNIEKICNIDNDLMYIGWNVCF